MVRNLLAGMAALALMSGAAFAQDSTYYRRTETVSTPFGTSETRTTTTRTHSAPNYEEDMDAAQAPPPGPVVQQPPIYDEQSADVGTPPPPEPPSNYDQVTTTRRIGPDGVETRRTDSYRKRQTFYDANGELSARTTTTTKSDSTRYGPAPVYTPNPVAAGPAPSVDLPPYRSRTTTTTTTTEDGE